MADRFFVAEPIAGDVAQLAGQEAHHLAHVMRAKVGQSVVLFDGSGAEFSAVIRRVGRAEIDLDVLERREVDRELPLAIVLGVALPKGDRQRWLVEKATELGVRRLVPLLTARSNQRESASAMEKLRRGVIEASKQCGRNRLMEIAAPTTVEAFLTESDPTAARWIAHPGGEAIGASAFAEDGTAHNAGQPFAGGQAYAGGLALAVGPEGGFTDAEIAAARERAWREVDLGTRILRIETAALALVARVALA